MNSTIETNNALENKDAKYWINKGREFQNAEKYEEAIKYYEKAAQLDQNWAYYTCKKILRYGIKLYELAEVNKDGKRYKEAIKYFIKSKEDILSIFVLLYKNNKNRKFQPKYFYKLLDNEVFFLKSIEKDKANLNKYKDIYLRSIFIISQLHISNKNEKLVAHYSKKEISQKLVFDSEPKFRLNAINYSNDPTEGKTLLDFFYGKEKYKTDGESNNKEYEAFASCFTFNYDSLNLFRLYGKEKDKEGTGLSLVFKNDFFSRGAEMSNDNSQKNEKFSLFRCIYIDPNPKTDQHVVTVGRKEKYLFHREEKGGSFKDYNEEMEGIIKQVSDEMDVLKNLAEDDGIDYAIVGQLLLNLRYLVKHVAFKEEQECRIVKILNLSNDESIKIDDYKQMYIEYSPKISEHIDKIYFGPKAEGIELFKSMLKYKGLDIPCEKSENPLA